MQNEEFESFMENRINEIREDLKNEFHEPQEVLKNMYRGMINAYTQCLNSYRYLKEKEKNNV
jgi:hypothetical protein